MSENSYWEQVQWTTGFDNETDFLGAHSPTQVAINTSITCLALLGNCLVITVMLARRRVFSSTVNRLILHQSIIDAVASVVFFLHRVVKDPIPTVSTDNTFYDKFVCCLLYVDVLLWCMYVASTYNLILISLDRFLATCYPLKHRKIISSEKVKFTLAIPWGVGLAHSLQFVFIFQPHKGFCKSIPMDKTVELITSATVVIVEYLLPIAILTYAYTRMIFTLKKKTVHPTVGREVFFRRAKENVLKIVVLVGGAFILCWAPAEFEFVAVTFLDILVSDSVYSAFSTLVACNMLINPIIYCFMYEHFRAQLKGVLRKGFRNNQVHDAGWPLPP